MIEYEILIYVIITQLIWTSSGYAAGPPRVSCIDHLVEHPFSFRGREMQNGPHTLKDFNLSMTRFGDWKFLISLYQLPKGYLDFDPEHFATAYQPMKGFMIQVRYQLDPIRPPQRLGTFDLDNLLYVQTMHCWHNEDTITQKGVVERTRLEMFWYPDPNFVGEVYAYATVIRSYTDHYRLKSESHTIVENPKERISSSTEPMTPRPTTTVATTTRAPSSTITSPITTTITISQNYNQMCIRYKNCLAYPADCLVIGSCKGIISWTRKEDHIMIDLMKSSPRGKYIAAGFSLDDKMGEDLVIVCAMHGGHPTKETIWNHHRLAIKETETIRLQQVEFLSSQYKNDILRCQAKVSTTKEIRISNLIYFGFNRPSYLLLASGTFQNGVTYHHDNKIVSENALDFSPNVQNSGENYHNSKAHMKRIFGFIFLNLMKKCID